MTAQAKNLWAPIRIEKRGNDWPVWSCIAYTRRAAKSKYLEGVPTECHKEWLQGIRFARVTVTEQEPKA